MVLVATVSVVTELEGRSMAPFQVTVPAGQNLLFTVDSVAGSGSVANVAAGITWAADNAHVINLSLGLRQDRPLLRQACAAASAAGTRSSRDSRSSGPPCSTATA